jgi:hypothetical protein
MKGFLHIAIPSHPTKGSPMIRLRALLTLVSLAVLLPVGMILAQETSTNVIAQRPPFTLPAPNGPIAAHVTGSSVQDFEGAYFPPIGWTNVASGGSQWLPAGYSGYGVGYASAAAPFYTTGSGAVLSLVSPLFTAAVAGDSLIFDHAYATYGTANDQLEVDVSTNGGTTWTILVTLDGGVSGPLVTAPAQTTGFLPTAAQWATKRYALAAGVNRFRLKATSAYGNNLFVDNIRGWKSFSNDAAVTSFEAPAPTIAPGSYAPKVSVGNAGDAATTFTITLTITPGGYTSTRTLTSFPAGSASVLSFDTWTPTPGVYQMKAICASASDQNHLNDTITATRIVATGQHHALLEFATGTWCQWCPCGDQTAETMANTYPGTVVIAYHGGGGGDPYLNFTGNAIINALGFTGYPTAIIDRQNSPGSYTTWSGFMQTRSTNAASPIDLAITGRAYNASTRQLTFNVEATANITLPLSYRLGIVLTENNLVYNQTGNTTCPGSSTWVHNWVCRGLLTPVAGMIINTGTWNAGQKNISASTTVLDASWIPANCRINAFVFQDGQVLGMSEVVNAISDVVVTGIGSEAGAVPAEYELLQNYPNPFNPTTNIAFAIPKAGFASLKIYDTAGREVMTALHETLQPGRYNVQIDANTLASGVYFYTLRTASFTQTRKMTLVR